jgi:flavin reductase (DIM6/NTAB) family NADH-FMN oxidoreductase RutF
VIAFRSPVDAKDHRRLMGTWATGVSLVTTTVEGESFGCTINSLTSLSLDPPSVLISLHAHSRTLAAIQRRGRFCINVLTSYQEALSKRFADPSLSMAERFGATEHGEWFEVPLISGCLATLVCDVMDSTRLCDHVVTAGHVVHGVVDDDKWPLVYFRGVYYTPRSEKEARGGPPPPRVSL